MDDTELTERLHDLQRSLQDGDDLARAIGLIGDALERRMERIRERLEVLEEDGTVPDGDRLGRVIDRVAATLDTYEDGIEERRARMEELIDEFQASLGEHATDLDDYTADRAEDQTEDGTQD